MSPRPKCLNRFHCSNLIAHHVSSVKVTQSLLNKSEKTRHFQCLIDSSKHRFVMGHSKVEVLVLTLSHLYLSVNTSVIRPIGHTFLGVDSSTITVSPKVKFLLGETISGAPATKESILISIDPRTHLPNTALDAIFSWNKCCSFQTVLVVESRFGEVVGGDSA